MRAHSQYRNTDEPGKPAAAIHVQQAADCPSHQRYYTLISRAVIEQGVNTFSSRETLYERARAAQMAALRKYDPPLTEDKLDRERLALEQAIALVERETASQYGSEFAPSAKAQRPGFVANQDRPSTSDRRALISKMERGALALFAIVALALSPLIFIRGVWITDTAVSYLAWPVNMITKMEYPSSLATYQILYSDGVAQEIRLFPEEIERWIRKSNMANADRGHRVVRVVDPQGRVIWEQ
jgi:hypothetical protein